MGPGGISGDSPGPAMGNGRVKWRSSRICRGAQERKPRGALRALGDGHGAADRASRGAGILGPTRVCLWLQGRGRDRGMGRGRGWGWYWDRAGAGAGTGAGVGAGAGQGRLCGTQLLVPRARARFLPQLEELQCLQQRGRAAGRVRCEHKLVGAESHRGL